MAEPLSLAHIDADDGEMGRTLRSCAAATAPASTPATAATTYTCHEVLAAERRIVAAALRVAGAPSRMPTSSWRWLTPAAPGQELNEGQVAWSAKWPAAGAESRLALAPAGTGKTTAMAALSHAWRSSGGTIIGLAPTAAAAIELGEDLSAPTDTIAKYVWSATPGGTPTGAGSARSGSRNIGPDTLIIIDEAGKAGTLDLDAVITHALARGASIRLIGDDCQLGIDLRWRRPARHRPRPPTP